MTDLRTSDYLTSKQAADLLGVSLPTLYAYVSRGLLRSRPDRDPRKRLYARVEVEALLQGREIRRDPGQAAAKSLQWGPPLLDSAITLIREGRFFYRGLDAVDLSDTRRLEQVARWLWLGETSDDTPAPRTRVIPKHWRPTLTRFPARHPGELMQLLVRLAAAEDDAGFNLRPEAVAKTGERLLAIFAANAAGGDHYAHSMAATLQRAWSTGDPRPEIERALNGALILCADHELNISSFTARCVAAAGASPYEVVNAGLSALRGMHHGGHSDRAEALLRHLLERDDPASPQFAERGRAELSARLARGDELPGYGQKLYPDGDPRFHALKRLTQAAFPDEPRVHACFAVIRAGAELLGEHPTVDYGLAALAVGLGLPPGSAWHLFAMGRCVGWLAHAIEQYQDSFIRPRARYVGPPPAPRSGNDDPRGGPGT